MGMSEKKMTLLAPSKGFSPWGEQNRYEQAFDHSRGTRIKTPTGHPKNQSPSWQELRKVVPQE
jgi:hypothetical protein